jgi:hypothetical protein
MKSKDAIRNRDERKEIEVEINFGGEENDEKESRL